VSPPIINQPRLQTLRQRYAYSALTFVFWAIWLYLWLPLISLLAWFIGIRLFHDEMIVHRGYQAFFNLVGWYALVVLIIGSTLLGWAGYNLFRFRGKERRKSAGSSDKNDIAQQFAVQIDQLQKWHRAKRLTIHHTEEGHIERVHVHSHLVAVERDRSGV
jgi:biofilm PGA synthesis protein PgaD